MEKRPNLCQCLQNSIKIIHYDVSHYHYQLAQCEILNNRMLFLDLFPAHMHTCHNLCTSKTEMVPLMVFPKNLPIYFLPILHHLALTQVLKYYPYHTFASPIHLNASTFLVIPYTTIPYTSPIHPHTAPTVFHHM